MEVTLFEDDQDFVKKINRPTKLQLSSLGLATSPFTVVVSKQAITITIEVISILDLQPQVLKELENFPPSVL